MKKTFFKRSMASVLSTCLVLTQGVFAAPAVTNLAANAADTTVTIKSFTDIAPDADPQRSEWGLTLNTLYKQNAPEVGGTVPVSASVAQDLLKGYTGVFRNGAYESLANAILDNLQTGVMTRTGVETYEVNFELAESGALIADEANTRLAKQVETTLGAGAASYMTPLDFSGFSVKGSVTVNLDLSGLNDSNEITATYLFTDENGTSYTLFGDGGAADLYEYIGSKYDEAAAIVKNAITDETPAELQEVLETKLANGKKTINGYMDQIDAKYAWIKGMNATRTGKDVNAALEGLYALYGGSKFYPQALKSLDTLAASTTWAERYASAANTVNNALSNNGFAYGISYDDVMSYLGTLSNVAITVSGGTAVMTADMPEDQMAELEAYYTGLDQKVVSSVKHVELKLDLVSGAAAGGALNITREIEIEDIKTETTTSEVTTTTTEVSETTETTTQPVETSTTEAVETSTTEETTETTTSEVTTTTTEVSETTETTTQPVETSTTEAVETSTTEETTETTTAPITTTTTVETTQPDNMVKYEMPTVAAQPGDVVEIPVTVYCNSPVNGISLNLAADETLFYDSFAAGTAYTGEPEWNAENLTYNWEGEADEVAADTALFTVSFIVPADAEIGVYPITFNAENCQTVNANGDVLTAEYVNGAIVVEGAAATIDGYEFNEEAALIGDMFWSEDPTPFDTADLGVKVTVSGKTVQIVDGAAVEETDTQVLPLTDLYALSANSASELEYIGAGEYTIGILVNETAMAAAINELTEIDFAWGELNDAAVAGKFNVLVGLRGDCNLDGKVDVADAVQILQYSAAAILEEAGGKPEVASDDIIAPDSLAKFCADVDCYKDAENAKINTADAVCILNYSAKFLADGEANWADIPGANEYVAYAQVVAE